MPGGASQADILRTYLECEVSQAARLAFYRWFDAPVERFRAALADQALVPDRAQQVDLSSILAGVKDCSMVDSTTVTVRDVLREGFPGAEAYAATKVHMVLSIVYGVPVHDHFSPAREQDSRPLGTDAAWQGCGVLADLASACLVQLRACTTHGVRVVIRLKDSWQSKVDSIARGLVTQERFPQTALDVLLEEEILQLDEWTIDADVRTGSPKDPLHLRCVGIHTPKGYGFCLTNRPPRIGPGQAPDLYQVRWEVDLSIKLEKSVHRLDQIDAEHPCSAKPLLHASLIASIIAALLAHTHNVRLGPSQEGMRRPKTPLHPRRIALQLAVSCQSMAQAVDLTGAAVKRRWQQITALLMPSGKVPNERRRSSVLDQLRGWKRQSGARKRANRDALKAAS